MEKSDFSDVERVISDEMRFKAKLAIGENAYTSLRNVNAVRRYWDLFGAVGGGTVIAASPMVATTFFAPTGILGLLGLATAATPIGWVVAAGVLGGGAWFGLMRGLGGATGSRVDVIPKFINTPIDVIGTTLFGFMTPLALKVAAADGCVSNNERAGIRDYFVKQWGFDLNFVEAGMQLMESKLSEFNISEVAEKLVEYKKSNPDCNYEVMAKDLLAFLQEVMESDGVIDEREQLVLDKVKSIFAEADRISIANTLAKLGTGVSESIKKGAKVAAAGAEAAGKGLGAAAETMRGGAGKAAQLTKGLAEKFKK